ncbi:MAG TPA: DUF4430 domain-containing protein [Candidatus Paceibacterota bacterium]|nr:DUF4430 domain-containing protein [Candidatus Paceibacterota bacterium]
MNTSIFKYVKYLAIGLVIFLLGASMSSSLGFTPENKSSNLSEMENAGTASIMIDYGNGLIKVYNSLSVNSETNVFNLLEESGVDFLHADYGAGLGAFINTIEGVGPDPEGKKWWQYWVNNQYATAGVSLQKVNAGDIIQFKFIEGQL